MKPERCPTCGRRNKRSLEQNAVYWVLLHAISEKLKPDGKTFSAQVWHKYFALKMLGAEEMHLPGGRPLILPRSTTSLDVAEFSDYLEKVMAWAAERDVYLDSLEAA